MNDLKVADIIEDSVSSFASPALLVRKKNGDYRMCIDYRSLNKNTVKDKFPIPLIDDQLERMYGNKYFTSLDLFSGYYQVVVDKECRELTAFVTQDGHYQFRRMPFGLCNAPSVFQRLINKVLGQLRYEVAMAYLDDIIIPSKNFENGLERLKLVLDSLSNANLTLNLSKCRFFMEKITYLGFEISLNSIGPSAENVKSIVEFPRPKCVRDVRSFIGMASYFRRFIRGFALVTRPMTDLLKKNADFNWGPAEDSSFNEVKAKLTSKPILAAYNVEAPTEIQTDASALGIGGVLLQKQESGLMKPISYFSRKTTVNESRYHSYELEALAIVSTVERFRTYLIGIHFVIRTDCNSLKLLASKRDMCPRIGRWFVKLSEFNYTIEYQKGKENMIADLLSRNPIEEGSEIDADGLPVMSISVQNDWISGLQESDPEIVKI